MNMPITPENSMLKKESNVTEQAMKFVKDNLTPDWDNKMEIVKELKEKFGLSMLEAANLTGSIISELRVNRAAELLENNDEESVIKQLEQEWGKGRKRSEKKNLEKLVRDRVRQAKEMKKNS